MQDEIEDKAINLLVRTSELSLRTVIGAGKQYLNHRNKVKTRRATKKAAREKTKARSIIRRGKQTVSELVGQGQGVENIDVSKTYIKGFEVYARKYGIDYAVRKDISENPPKYLVFFKARDASAMMAAFNEYSAKILKKDERPSIIEALKKLKEKVAEVPGRIREKIQERGDR